MKNPFLTSIAALAACALTFTTPSSAENFNWSLNGTYTDGSGNQWSGSFTYDADSGTFSKQALQIGTTLCTVTSVANNTLTCTSGSAAQTLALSGPVTDAGGALTVGTSSVDLVGNPASFDSVNIGQSVTQTYTFTVPNADTLANPPYVVLTQGAQNLDFQAAGTQPSNACVGGNSYTVGAICAVSITFAPTKPYQRIGAVQLMGSAGTPLATIHLVGAGVGPQVGFPRNSAVTILPSGSGYISPFGVAVDGAGDVFVADDGNSAVKEIVAVNGMVSASSPVITVGSGFSAPDAVAVDGAGNVFVADIGDTTAVYEIVAVNGAVSASSTVIAVGFFAGPTGVAVDGAGNVFVADFDNTAVDEIVAVNGVVSSNSQVITLGSGFSGPYGVAVDANGNVFVSDITNNAVYEIVAVNGAVSASSQVVALGSGFSAPQAVTVDGSGNLFVVDSSSNPVKEILAVNGIVSSSSQVVALGSGFSGPLAVTVDAAGNVFIADGASNAVKEIDRSDPPSLSFANISVGQTTSAPQSVTIQNIGNATLTATNLTIGTNFTQAAGSGTPADCTSSTTLASGGSCNLSISFTPTAPQSAASTAVLADNSLNNLGATQTIPLAIVPDVTLASTSTGNLGSANVCPGGVTSSCTTQSSSLTFNVAINETLGTPIVRTEGAQNLDFTLGTTSTCNGGISGGGTCTVNINFTPRFAGLRKGAVQIVDSNGNVISTTYISGIGIGPQVAFTGNPAVTTLPIGSGFNKPFGVAMDGAGNVFVADTPNNSVEEILAVNGAVSASSTVITVGSGFNTPFGVAVDGAGNVFVADAGNNAVKEIAAVNGAVSASSTVITVGSAFNYPLGVAVDGAGNVFVADTANSAVKEILAVNGAVSASSTVVTIGSGFNDPAGVAVDAAGDVFVGDDANNAVKEIVAVNGMVSASSTVNTIGGGFTNPIPVAVDAAGDVFVGDEGNNAVKEIIAVNGVVSSNSQVITLASGFNSPEGVAVDAAGNVFVGDQGNSAVKEINRSTPPSLTFANTVVGQTSSDSPQSVSIGNVGNAPLTTTALAIGPNFMQTLLNGTPADCTSSTTLASGANCNLSISFAPTTGGPLTGIATLTDNALNATGGMQSIALSGGGASAVTVNASIPGASFSVDGTAYTTAQTFNWVTGSTHTLATTSPQIPSAGTQYGFIQWSDGTTSTTDMVTASASITSYTANFTTQYLLTVAASPSSGGTVTDSGYVNVGTVVTLTAAPATGYFLASWTGPVTAPTGNSATVTMNAPKTVTANFQLGVGSWPGIHGADGYLIANEPAQPPSYATVTVNSDQKPYTWQSPSTDPRALQTAPGATTRIASAYWSYVGFKIAVNLTDTNSHQLTLYLLDWANSAAARSENITLTNTANNVVLSSQCYTGFQGGEFVSWTISSSVSVQVTSYKDSKCTVTGGAPNAVVSGIFFDPVPVPATSPYNGTDTVTQGTYTGLYGGQGGMIANKTTPVTSAAVTKDVQPLLTGSVLTLPSYANLSLTGAAAFVWVNPTSDVRALQTGNGSTNRIASAYYSPTSFTMNVNLTDGQTHLVSLYLLDWDSNARQEKITILDANTKNVLDTETYANFHNGEYASWLMTGHVLIQVTNTAGTKNAVVSGIFFDSAAAAVTPTAMPGPTDTATQGAWGGVYGSNGNAIATEPASLAAFANVTVTQDSQFPWASSTTDIRALQTTSGSTSLAATCYYSAGAFDINVDLTDGQSHKVSLYLVDWDNRSRVETITVLDAAKGTVLIPAQSFSGFQGGEYASWTVTGHVVFQVKKTSGPNAVLSGVFID